MLYIVVYYDIMYMYIPLMNYVYAIFINYFSTQIKINNIL